ncbi:MAG: L,D-transpeptidase [Myxococcales bacterium]|nr:MAG: L,D-transpeptidase [Myxococcales bacterium]
MNGTSLESTQSPKPHRPWLERHDAAPFRAALVEQGEGCKGKWLRLPGNGFACTAQGFALQKPEQDNEDKWVPMPPALDSALPYPYGRVVREGSPQYWRLPSREEEIQAMQIMKRIAERTQKLQNSTVDGEDPAPEEEQASASDEQPEAVPETNPAVEEATEEEALPDFIRMRMQAGYYVSLDRFENHEGQDFFRTIRGGFLRADDIVEVTAPPMRGVIVGGVWSLPLAFVWRAYTRAYQYNPSENKLKVLYDLPRHTPLALKNDNFIHEGKAYVLSREEIAARMTAVRIAKAVRRPAIIPVGEKWIHINLKQQTVIAYEGDKPVFATLASTGKKDFETPPGVFRMVSKHVSTTMDDFTSQEQAYSIEDVPWVMYYSGSYALHGAFWHNRFGQTRSHGCVNLSPIDARWLFQWSEPTLPNGWHSLFSSRDRPGTWIYVDTGEEETN